MLAMTIAVSCMLTMTVTIKITIAIKIMLIAHPAVSFSQEPANIRVDTIVYFFCSIQAYHGTSQKY